ncbi:hypothetical protein [Adhaeribacter soli]|uniref:Uncharacterized protein n=1 Tax=Adhaeribacter soli TaxID=2607655 RepID=A0A5N1J6T0_9BACT|nr:hypothetical protein [Adhaeribacter soli]KAA9340313.1 hypothetical protein F0P94_08175 [Adhaeribacter soli]
MFRLVPVLIILFCSSCSFLAGSIYGIKSPKKLNQTEIASQAKKYNIPLENSFELDTAYFFEHLKSFDQKRYFQQINNHSQALQSLFFDKDGRLQVFYINCYAGGFPNLAWNKEGQFNSFPPKPQAPLDSLLDLQTLSRYLIPLPTTKPQNKISADYTIVVFWNRMMNRQTKHLIQLVQENAGKAKDQHVQLLYVNTDNLMATN